MVAVGLDGLGSPKAAGGLAGFAAAFGLRAAALIFDLALPAYRPRPGRPWSREVPASALRPPPDP